MPLVDGMPPVLDLFDEVEDEGLARVQTYVEFLNAAHVPNCLEGHSAEIFAGVVVATPARLSPTGLTVSGASESSG